jgi:hypothetical protein
VNNPQYSLRPTAKTHFFASLGQVLPPLFCRPFRGLIISPITIAQNDSKLTKLSTTSIGLILLRAEGTPPLLAFVQRANSVASALGYSSRRTAQDQDGTRRGGRHMQLHGLPRRYAGVLAGRHRSRASCLLHAQSPYVWSWRPTRATFSFRAPSGPDMKGTSHIFHIFQRKHAHRRHCRTYVLSIYTDKSCPILIVPPTGESQVT